MLQIVLAVFNKPECRRVRCGKEAAKNRRCIVFWGLQTVVRTGFAVASRTHLFSTPKFSISLVRPVYLLSLWARFLNIRESG